MIPPDIWGEQLDFNAMLRPELPRSEEEIAEYLRDMSINMVSEIDELLRTTSWKKHRRTRTHRPNHEYRLEQLIDQFKLWLSQVQELGYTPEEVRQAFWRKSMVCRQRHSEEFVKDLDRPSVVIDIDNVLCDYTTGFCTWLINRAPLFAKAAQQLMIERRYFNRASDFGMTEAEWQGMKHEFRSKGHKRFLPTMPGAKEFLVRVREAGYQIILLTSRPIDRYPNIYTDTIWWLNDQNLPFDWVWWSTDKGEKVVESGALKYVRFVVDDDLRYVGQFIRVGLNVWHLESMPQEGLRPESDLYHNARTLQDIDIPPLKGL